MSSRTTFGWHLVALAVAVAVCGGTASAQSLAEVARKEEERRKAIKAPSKVYTNESIGSEPAPARPAAPAGQAPGGAAAPPSASGVQPPSQSGVEPPAAGDAQRPAEEPPADDARKDEAYWRQRIEAAQDALARARIFAEALQSRINALTADFTARDDPAQRDVIAVDRQRALAELDRVNREIGEHEKAIADIREEARRAGVPPGWLR